ncbi:ribonuclease H-like domain-containing protein [Candidatus Woesearchaeota archaeon]|nr:ribonuclease H-like domain-containing protein [Candidatus Woesearchaeota archaeon]
MIQNTFLFLERVKRGLEESLWQQGIRDWDSFLNREKIAGIGKKRKLYYDRKILEARKALYNFDSSYFKKILPSSEYYRLYDFFKEDAIFLDIETTGLDQKNDDITLIGLFNGIDTKTMIKGINFDLKGLKKELSRYKLIVTFNGASFDVPFIDKLYPGLLPDIPNFDVKTITGRLELKGGLKEVEKTLGIRRKRIIERFYGGDALRLWRMYRAAGDDYYLNLLVEYNEEDIINLKKIAEFCIEKMKSKFNACPSL